MRLSRWNKVVQLYFTSKTTDDKNLPLSLKMIKFPNVAFAFDYVTRHLLSNGSQVIL